MSDTSRLSQDYLAELMCIDPKFITLNSWRVTNGRATEDMNLDCGPTDPCSTVLSSNYIAYVFSLSPAKYRPIIGVAVRNTGGGFSGVVDGGSGGNSTADGANSAPPDSGPRAWLLIALGALGFLVVSLVAGVLILIRRRREKNVRRLGDGDDDENAHVQHRDFTFAGVAEMETPERADRDDEDFVPGSAVPLKTRGVFESTVDNDADNFGPGAVPVKNRGALASVDDHKDHDDVDAGDNWDLKPVAANDAPTKTAAGVEDSYSDRD